MNVEVIKFISRKLEQGRKKYVLLHGRKMWDFWNSTSRPVAFSSGKIYFYIPVQYTIYCKHRIVYNALVYASPSCMWEGQEQKTWQVCFCLRCKHKIIVERKANLVIHFSSYSIYAEQCCEAGAGAARSRNFWPEPELEPECRNFGSGSRSA